MAVPNAVNFVKITVSSPLNQNSSELVFMLFIRNKIPLEVVKLQLLFLPTDVFICVFSDNVIVSFKYIL